MLLYLDASAIIYAIEGVPALRRAALQRIDQIESNPEGILLTSRLSTLECRVRPLREGDRERLARFDGFFGREKLVVTDVSASVIDRATELRARHGFRTPDAIHLATALLEGAGVFLTGDTSLRKCPGLDVKVLTPE